MARFVPARGALTAIGLAAVLILVVASNILVAALFPSARLDLTQGRLYTLSDGTAQVIASVQEPITLRLFLSERLVREAPGYAPFAQRVRDLLAEYQTRSHGRISVEVYDPLPFTDVEDRAQSYGLQGVPVSQEGEQVYFGLVGTNSTDDEEVIPFFQVDRDRFLEYDLTRLVNKLANPKQRVVGVLSTLPILADPAAGQRPQAWMVVDQLRQFFEVRAIAPTVSAIPADVDAMIVVHPAGLPEGVQYAIDQFVLRGGKALIFADPWSEAAQIRTRRSQAGATSGPNPVSDLPKLFRSWGIQLEPGVVVGDRRNARKVSTEVDNRVRAVDYLPWIILPADRMNADDPITAQIEQLTFGTAGSLKTLEGATTQIRPLVRSSTTSQKLSTGKVQAMPPDVMAILRDFKSGDQELTIAARITGPAKTAFPEGPPKPAETPAEGGEAKPTEPLAPQLTESKQPIDVIVVADTDMLEDGMWAQVSDFFGQRMTQETAGNGTFVVNAIDNLTGTSGLIRLRSRGLGDRPFTLIREIQQQADSQYRAREEELSTKLKETQRKLAELRRGGEGGGAAIVTPEQSKEIEASRAELIQLRGALRDVQRELRVDIERVEAQVRFVAIALVPLLVAVFAIGLGILRARRRRRAHHASVG